MRASPEKAEWTWQSTFIASAAADGHLGDQDGRRRAAREETDVGAHGHDVLEHALEGGGDGDLTYGLGPLPVAHHQATGPGREVSRHGVGSGVQAGDALHIEGPPRLLHQLIETVN